MARIKSVERHEHDVLRALIKQWRLDLGLTKQMLSVKLERPKNYIHKVESGVKGVEVVDFIDIVRALRRDVGVAFREYNDALEAAE